MKREIPPHRELTDFELKKTIESLLRSGQTRQEVAKLLGFNNMQYFYRRAKKVGVVIHNHAHVLVGGVSIEKVLQLCEKWGMQGAAKRLGVVPQAISMAKKRYARQQKRARGWGPADL